MFFYASKLLWALFQPLCLVMWLLTAGLIFRAKRWGRGIAVFGLSFFALISFLPIGHNLVAGLENAYPFNKIEALAPYNTAIILGGAVEGDLSASRDTFEYGNSAERVLRAVELFKTYPQMKFIYTGGNADIAPSSISEGDIARKALEFFGIPAGSIVIENKSRTTLENMANLKAQTYPRYPQSIILITSAFHMKRAVKTFENGGFQVVPDPVDFQTDGQFKWRPDMNVLGNIYLFQIAVKEYIGIIAYSIKTTLG